MRGRVFLWGRASNKSQTLTSSYILFDWYLKRLERNAARFDVLEGFLSVLLSRQVEVEERVYTRCDNEREKDERLDVALTIDDIEPVLCELQCCHDHLFFSRMHAGRSTLLSPGDVLPSKVYCVNLIHFERGKSAPWDDYVYHGYERFRGLHSGTERSFDDVLFDKPRETYLVGGRELRPEYFFVMVGEYDAKDCDRATPLEEWMRYLQDGCIERGTTVPGLVQAREQLREDDMEPKELGEYRWEVDYYRYIKGNPEVMTPYRHEYLMQFDWYRRYVQVQQALREHGLAEEVEG